jgi:hypothetical protein
MNFLKLFSVMTLTVMSLSLGAVVNFDMINSFPKIPVYYKINNEPRWQVLQAGNTHVSATIPADGQINIELSATPTAANPTYFVFAPAVHADGHTAGPQTCYIQVHVKFPARTVDIAPQNAAPGSHNKTKYGLSLAHNVTYPAIRFFREQAAAMFVAPAPAAAHAPARVAPAPAPAPVRVVPAPVDPIPMPVRVPTPAPARRVAPAQDPEPAPVQVLPAPAPAPAFPARPVRVPTPPARRVAPAQDPEPAPVQVLPAPAPAPVIPARVPAPAQVDNQGQQQQMVGTEAGQVILDALQALATATGQTPEALVRELRAFLHAAPVAAQNQQPQQ